MPPASMSLVLFCALACLPAPGRAAEETAVLVVLHDIPSAEVKKNLAGAVRSLAGDLEIGVKLVEDIQAAGGAFDYSSGKAAGLASAYGADFVFFIRQNDVGRLVIYVYDAGNDSMLVKEVKTQQRSGAVLVEAASIMIHGYLKLISEGGRIGIHPSHLEEGMDAAKSGAGEVEAPQTLLELLVAYQMDTLSPEQPLVQGLAAAVGFAPRSLKNVYFEFSYKLSPTISVGDERVFMEINQHPFTLGLRYNFEKKFFRMLPGLAVTLQYVKQHSIAREPNLGIPTQGSFLQVALTPSIRFSFRLVRHLDLFVQTSLDIYLKRGDLAYEHQGTSRPLITPWHTGFNLLCGISVRLI